MDNKAIKQRERKWLTRKAWMIGGLTGVISLQLSLLVLILFTPDESGPAPTPGPVTITTILEKVKDFSQRSSEPRFDGPVICGLTVVFLVVSTCVALTFKAQWLSTESQKENVLEDEISVVE